MAKTITKAEAQEATLTDQDHELVKSEAVKAGAKAWRSLKQRAKKDLELWYQVGEALLTLRRRLESENNGKVDKRKFRALIDEAGLGELAQEDRTAAQNLVIWWQELSQESLNGAGHPRVVLRRQRAIEKQSAEPAQVEDKSKEDNSEDAEFSDVGPDIEGDDGADTVSGPVQVSGSDPWWKRQTDQIADLPELVPSIDPDGLASSVLGVQPVEKYLTKEKLKRIRERAQQIQEFCDRYEEQAFS